MVQYSIDTEPRKFIYVGLAAMSIVIVYTVSLELTKVGVGAIAPTVMAVYGALYKVFDIFLWKWIPWIKILNLEGTWKGDLIRGTVPGTTTGKTGSVEIRITQTWTRIDISLEGTHSLGVTEAASLFIKNPRRREVVYGYHKRPKDATGQGHEYSNGYTRLMYEKENGVEILRGRYFSDEFRGGSIVVTKISS